MKDVEGWEVNSSSSFLIRKWWSWQYRLESPLTTRSDIRLLLLLFSRLIGEDVSHGTGIWSGVLGKGRQDSASSSYTWVTVDHPRQVNLIVRNIWYKEEKLTSWSTLSSRSYPRTAQYQVVYLLISTAQLISHSRRDVPNRSFPSFTYALLPFTINSGFSSSLNLAHDFTEVGA